MGMKGAEDKAWRAGCTGEPVTENLGLETDAGRALGSCLADHPPNRLELNG